MTRLFQASLDSIASNDRSPGLPQSSSFATCTLMSCCHVAECYSWHETEAQSAMTACLFYMVRSKHMACLYCPFWAKTIVQLVYANDGFLPQIWQRQLSC